MLNLAVPDRAIGHNGCMSSRDEVLRLSRSLGAQSEDLAILAEGNASGIEDEETFWIKASGFSLASLTSEQLVRVRFSAFQNLPESVEDEGVRKLLAECRADETELLPSVETFMHAFLLRLPGVSFVGHTHPTPLLSLLCLERAELLSRKRLFPDEIVCCGPASVFVPYRDPGLPLAQEIRARVLDYMKEWEEAPRTIWLANHGLIALGSTRSQVESASRMAVKAARVWLGAMSAGETLVELSQSQIKRIHSRPDEHYRQRILAVLGQSSA